MEILTSIFGEGKDLNALQMSARGILVFLLTLVMIRISGRRSFGIKTTFDNIIVILLGSILSRAVAGVSPFVPTIVASFAIVALHRLFGYLVVRSERFGKLVEGQKILLFSNNEFIRDRMNRALVCKEDILQGVRKSALTESLDGIERVYMERNGEISAIKKKE
jgi:uncharacterized membrane protein YcaP (DUF421 family)